MWAERKVNWKLNKIGQVSRERRESDNWIKTVLWFSGDGMKVEMTIEDRMETFSSLSISIPLSLFPQNQLYWFQNPPALAGNVTEI